MFFSLDIYYLSKTGDRNAGGIGWSLAGEAIVPKETLLFPLNRFMTH